MMKHSLGKITGDTVFLDLVAAKRAGPLETRIDPNRHAGTCVVGEQTTLHQHVAKYYVGGAPPPTLVAQ